MTIVLPSALPSASGWQLADFLNLQLRSAPAAAGQAQIDGRQLGPDEMWFLDHMVSDCDSSAQTTLRLYESVVDRQRLLDGTSTGNFDVADWPAGLQVRPSASLVAVWVGASTGARGVLTLQGRILRRV